MTGSMMHVDTAFQCNRGVRVNQLTLFFYSSITLAIQDISGNSTGINSRDLYFVFLKREFYLQKTTLVKQGLFQIQSEFFKAGLLFMTVTIVQTEFAEFLHQVQTAWCYSVQLVDFKGFFLSCNPRANLGVKLTGESGPCLVPTLS